MPTISSETLHASCVAIDDVAVLIEGMPGAGKSDLALRLIDRGAALVSDDYTMLVRRGNELFASAPTTIAGKMEVRGLGILDMAHVEDIRVALIVALATEHDRMPAEGASRPIVGVDLPLVWLDARPASAPVKVELALKRLLANR